jgi:hypothetical protein
MWLFTMNSTKNAVTHATNSPLVALALLPIVQVLEWGLVRHAFSLLTYPHAAPFRWSDSHPDQQIPLFNSFKPKLGILLKSISSGAQYVVVIWSAKIFFSHPSLVYLLLLLLFSPLQNPTHKTTETPILQIHGGLLIANHLDQSLWLVHQKHCTVVKSYLVHYFLNGCFHQPLQT